ncbi:hypothetical protein [Aurantiacibacter gilvus]|uniref:Uncharacterized protein n=1 Tax=Aurantiacibacter gilvus TaxID=3139141 RepID=A0ABU9IDY8_9SPHN
MIALTAVNPICAAAQDIDPIELPSEAEVRAYLEAKASEWEPIYQPELGLQGQTGQLILIDNIHCYQWLDLVECSASMGYRFDNERVVLRERQFTFRRNEVGELQSVIVLVHERRRAVRDLTPVVTIPEATVPPDFGLQLPDER